MDVKENLLLPAVVGETLQLIQLNSNETRTRWVSKLKFISLGCKSWFLMI